MFVKKMKKFFQDDETFLKIESLIYEGKKFQKILTQNGNKFSKS